MHLSFPFASTLSSLIFVSFFKSWLFTQLLGILARMAFQPLILISSALIFFVFICALLTGIEVFSSVGVEYPCNCKLHAGRNYISFLVTPAQSQQSRSVSWYSADLSINAADCPILFELILFKGFK